MKMNTKYVGDLTWLIEKGVKIREVDVNWIKGTYKKLYFEAKVYTEPSKFGIRGGRTSKLNIYTDPKNWRRTQVFAYDRGYDLRAKIKMAKELVSIFSTGDFGKGKKKR